MNWLKDNILFMLCLCLIGCGVAITVLLLNKAHMETAYTKLDKDYTKLKADFSNVKDASDINAANVEAITKMYNELVAKNKIERDKAQRTAQELEDYQKATAQTLAENKKLRAQLGELDADVNQYLHGVIPQPLACQLWPEAGACRKGGKK